MVNTGKASQACAVCKRRKIKCDLAKPACSQCIRSGWDCPGPKGELEVAFKDQTEIVTRSMSRTRPTTARSLNTASESLELRGFPRTVPSSTLDCGTAFFMHHYVFLGDGDSTSTKSRGHHEYLPALLRRESGNGPLRTIVAAAGLAALSNVGAASTWLVESYQLCNKAVRQLKSALSNPNEAFTDAILATMMIMGTFEAITSGNIDSMKVYGYHTMAAVRCIDLRGPKQFRGDAPLKLFLELRRIIFMTCHQCQTPISSTVNQWSNWAEQAQQPEELHSNEFAAINGQLAAARAEIKTQGVTCPAAIAAKLLPIDEQLIHWKQSLPESWSSSTHRVPDLNNLQFLVWQSQFDTYRDFWLATVLDNYRCVRLIVHEAIIKSIVAKGCREHQVLLQASMATTRETVDEICSSVPYILGNCPQNGEDTAMQSEARPIPGGYVLVWPLFLSAMMRTTPRAQRDWITGVLRHIGNRTGLKLAMSMAKVLQKNH
ncbi:hypothetical protein BKA63DRAFT_553373 [Paraphoma chrysanthemicola]|nr:hypothetical protein BKA63DRAFT_553373 [Paraphoma chrysanthemicola]